MILADSFIAFCTLILAVLFWFDVAQMWHTYILLACRSVGSAFHTPSMQASVPLLAPEAQLTRVAGVNQIINSLSNIIGPALGAVLISFTAHRQYPASGRRGRHHRLRLAAVRTHPQSRAGHAQT